MSSNLPTNKIQSSYQNSSGGAVTRNYPVIGIVKNNVDPTKSGRIQVALNDMGASDPDDADSWITVSYMSPFYGITKGATSPTKNKDNFGNYVDTQQSYGFWATPPDTGTMVMCVFANGDINQGYYIGCVPQPGSTQMTPALGASSKVVLNASVEAQSYGGSPRLPTAEVNYNNPDILNSDNFDDDARPVHSYLASTYQRQGLTRDPSRGPISSSAARESPSQVFGMSTPGRPIFEGGLSDDELQDTSAKSDGQLRVTGRRGGHSFVMDDGDQTGKDNLIRLRTALGHQIMLNDAEGFILITHANGKSWAELGSQGTIDLFGEDSFNVRVKGDLNLRADKNINIDAGENLQITSKNTQIQTDNLRIRSNGDFNVHTVGKYTARASEVNFYSSGIGSFASSANFYLNGSKIMLNTVKPPPPPYVMPMVMKVYPDSSFDARKGFVEAHGVAEGYGSRSPSHLPWTQAGKGAQSEPDVSTDQMIPEVPKEISDLTDSLE